MLVVQEDVVLLSAALRAAFPNIIFMPDPPYWKTIDRSKRPSAKTYNSIQACRANYVDMYLKPKRWVPRYEWRKPVDGQSHGHWAIQNQPVPILSFQGTSIERSYDQLVNKSPLHLSITSFLMSYNLNVAEHMKIKAKVNRVLNKVLTSNLVYVEWPSRKVIPNGGYTLWAGPHAIQWCRDDPSRVLSFIGFRTGKSRAWLPA